MKSLGKLENTAWIVRHLSFTLHIKGITSTKGQNTWKEQYVGDYMNPAYHLILVILIRPCYWNYIQVMPYKWWSGTKCWTENGVVLYLLCNRSKLAANTWRGCIRLGALQMPAGSNLSPSLVPACGGPGPVSTRKAPAQCNKKSLGRYTF